MQLQAQNFQSVQQVLKVLCLCGETIINHLKYNLSVIKQSIGVYVCFLISR